MLRKGNELASDTGPDCSGTSWAAARRSSLDCGGRDLAAVGFER